VALTGTDTQLPFEPLPHADAGGFPAQPPTRCPDASLTSTDANHGHRPVHVSSTRSDTDVTCVPLTPAPGAGGVRPVTRSTRRTTSPRIPARVGIGAGR
jgi:hypothetical protein